MKLIRHSTALCLFALAMHYGHAQTPAPQPATRQEAPPAPAHRKPTTFDAAFDTAAGMAPAAPKTVAKSKNNDTTIGLPPVPFNRAVIVLDPAHGGVDSGARISDSLLEKDVTLSLAFHLRSLLAARGFTVLLTRDSDAATEPGNPGAPLTLDDRAGIANHAHAAACLLLHATAAGTGVHLYSSELDPAPGEAASTPWLTAQAAWVTQSRDLQQQLAAALIRAGLPLVSSRASVRPLDSLTCPALIVELAPNGGDISTLNDAEYQQRVAQAIAGALVFWQNQAQPPPQIAPPATGAQP